MPNTLELRNVSKVYDKFVAVDNLSLAIEQGKVFGLLGPNGAGKTSSLRMMIGVTMPDSGEVVVFGEKFRREHLDRIGYLPEERGLYRKMKLLDQIIFLAQLKGVPEPEARRRATQWFDRLHLMEWTNKKVEELSKGMQQKVQFIACILHDPEFIILDEPFSGLDPANADELKNILHELRKAGKTILFSTHRMDQVEKLCDAICLVDHGRAVLQGELREVKARFGRNHVQIEYEGDGDFLQTTPLVQSFHNFGNYTEVELAPGADPQELLKAVAARARVNRFELAEPSLEKIFIDTVNGQTEKVQHA
ncbi:MAG TPA: ATP-binding cassette domain-containing protein [Terriglobales bacterium]|nr:ATP-binding cassette domain-containing protein [Terriglobales bacterium]